MRDSLIIGVVALLSWNSGCAFVSPSTFAPTKTGRKVLAVRPNSGAAVIPRERLGKIRNMVAIVVGISKYKYEGEGHPRLRNLDYAAADADALASHLVTSGFNKADLLTDQKATLAEIRRTLGGRIKAAQEDDFVLVFWAGHACASRKNPRKLYLMTYDADPDNLPDTAYAMSDFRAEISGIRAQRLMVVVDTCHSGGVSDPTVRYRGASAADINSALRGVYVAEHASGQRTGTKGSAMRLVFTACEAGEVSRESSKFGHGVFTYYLLESLQGKADANGDGIITLDEMIEYTRSKVRAFSKGQQNPSAAGFFDRSVPMGVIKK